MDSVTTSYKTRPLEKVFNRRTQDKYYHSIQIEPIIQILMDTPQVQRLRNLKQLGTVEYVYPGATHTRFEHSLGVMHLAGQMAQHIARKQPFLNIKDTDITCLRIAGLCHDLGHGPFSHVYDGVVVPALRKAHLKRESSSTNRKIGEWTHEDGSLMMIDAALESLGLAMDYANLDKPLKQIGDGVDALQFGFVDFNDNIVQPLTTRDWVFIKECILGHPLNLQDREFVGRPKSKEFLYDILSNRHCGLDVDKIDYYARDSANTQDAPRYNNILIEEAVVAKAYCVDPQRCFQCKHNKTSQNMHYMITWPQKLIQHSVEFFKTRFSMHSKVYTHKTAKAVEYMICDCLLAADPFLEIKAEGGHCKRISTAMEHPATYLKMRDEQLLCKIDDSESKELEPARQILKRLRSRDLYKCAWTLNISDDKSLEAWYTEEEEIKSQIVNIPIYYSKGTGSSVDYSINIHDLIVEKRQIHHGMKENNPVSRMRFLPKGCCLFADSMENLPVAKEVDEESYETYLPRSFMEKTIRIYSRNSDPHVVERINHCCQQWYFGKDSINNSGDDDEKRFDLNTIAAMSSPVPGIRQHNQHGVAAVHPGINDVGPVTLTQEEEDNDDLDTGSYSVAYGQLTPLVPSFGLSATSSSSRHHNAAGCRGMKRCTPNNRDDDDDALSPTRRKHHKTVNPVARSIQY